jgi:hypothetical protein
MNHARILYEMMRADFLERVRRTSFLLALGFALFLAYAVYTGEVTLRLNDYSGVPNSAWLGCVIGLVASVWIPLVGFYIVKNSIERDRQTRVGQILASTPMTRPLYTLGKALSNFAVLAAMVVALGLAAVVIQLANRHSPGPNPDLEVVKLLSPILLIGLSAVALTASLAVLFETLPGLKGGVGNVVYFFLWTGLIILGVPSIDKNAHASRWAPLIDYTGIGTMMGQMQTRLHALDPLYQGGASFSIGLPATTKTFLWTGLDWSTPVLLGRLMPVFAGILLALVAARFFDRFDPARGGLGRAPKPAKPKSQSVDVNANAAVVPHLVSAAQLTRIQREATRTRLVALISAELRLMLKGKRVWWYAVALGLWIACAASPLEVARSGILPFAWIWPLLLWSAMGTRESYFATGSLVFSAPNAALRQLVASYAGGVLVAAASGAGVAIRLVLANDLAGLGAWFAAALFIPALALALGVWAGSSKPFEGLYTAWWYVGPLHHIRGVDFMGTTAASSTAPAYAAAALLLVLVAYAGRRTKLAYA